MKYKFLKKIFTLLLLLPLLLNEKIHAVDVYTITLSPVFISSDRNSYVSDQLIYDQPLQTYQAGAFYKGGKVAPTGRYAINSKVILVATVKQNNMNIPNAEILWKINYDNKNNDKLTGKITACGETGNFNNFDKAIKAYSLSQTKIIYGQIPESKKEDLTGSGEYLPLTLLPGQSYIELTSYSPGITEIAAVLTSEKNPKKNTVYAAIEWFQESDALIDMSICDNGPLYFDNEPSSWRARNYAIFETTIKHNGGCELKDILTFQLPENWNFLFPKESKDFLQNFEIIKNDDYIPHKNFINDFKIISGILDNNTSLKKIYLSIKLSLNAGEKIILRIKARPNEKPNEKNGATILYYIP